MVRRTAYSCIFIVGLLWGAVGRAEAETGAPVLSRGNPWDVGLDWKTVDRGYVAIRTAIREKAGPGAVALVAKDGVIIRRGAFGFAQRYGERIEDDAGEVTYTSKQRRMKIDTIFDLASLTKMVATTTAIQILVEEGALDLDAPVVRHLPEFGAEGKNEVTARHLLTHTSGIVGWKNIHAESRGMKDVWAEICSTELDSPPGYRRVYSCLGYITLGKLIERISGMSLDRFTQKRIFRPLGMKDTGFRISRKERKRCATTEWSSIHERFLTGEVHDENAHAAGGVSGNAGLFSTATDLAIFCQMLLNRGAYGDVRILSPESVDRMLTPQLSQEVLGHGSGSLKGQEQLQGWYAIGDKMEMGATGGLPSPRAFGHTGYTGTSLWIDPDHGTFAILLTNAVHPSREKAERAKFRVGFYQAIWDALLDAERG